MDMISLLPDALLLQILSGVPTKTVVATSVLSKRWQSLWKVAPKLEFDCTDHNTKYGTFVEFVYRSLVSHKALLLESLHLKLNSTCAAVDIGNWFGIAVARCLRELSIDITASQRPMKLPSIMYSCDTLVVLKLRNAILMDVPLVASFSSLKTLQLLSVKYSGDESVPRLLSSCPCLEDLVVERCPDDNVITFFVKATLLQSLSIDKSNELQGADHGIVIDAPCLKYLSIKDYSTGFCLIEDAPTVVEANVDVSYSQTEKVLGSLTSVKRLLLCLLISEDPYPTGCIFNELVHLEMCTCDVEWWNLLRRILEDSPKLRVLKLYRKHNARVRNPNVCWNQPSSVPKCLLLHLETFEWRKYEGTQVEKDLATYILRNASRLQIATIFMESTKLEDQIRMLKELASVPRGSTSCRLLFE